MATPVKPDIPVGRFEMTWIEKMHPAGHVVRVDRADPRIAVIDELVYDMLMAKAAAVRCGATPNCSVDWTVRGLVMTIRCGVTGEAYVYVQDPPERQPADAHQLNYTTWTAVD